MRIYPAVHYTMGGLWVDYDLQSTIPGLFVIGEANFSDHGANRLGASALMQGLADGYFVLPNTINDYLAAARSRRSTTPPGGRGRARRSRGRIERCWPSTATARPTPSTASSATHVGLLRHGAHRGGPAQGDRAGSASCSEEFWAGSRCPARRRSSTSRWRRPAGSPTSSSWRADVHRRAAPRGVLRWSLPRGVQTADGEALRDDEHFAYVAAWEFTGAGPPVCTRKT